MTDKLKRSITVGKEAYKEYKKETKKARLAYGIGQSLAEQALELEPEETGTKNKTCIQFRVDDKTWYKLQEKAKKENTSISRLIERILILRSDIHGVL